MWHQAPESRGVRDGGRTLSELAHALLAGTPVIGLGTWRIDREPGSERDAANDPIVRVATPAAAVAAALQAGVRRTRG